MLPLCEILDSQVHVKHFEFYASKYLTTNHCLALNIHVCYIFGFMKALNLKLGLFDKAFLQTAEFHSHSTGVTINRFLNKKLPSF